MSAQIINKANNSKLKDEKQGFILQRAQATVISCDYALAIQLYIEY